MGNFLLASQHGKGMDPLPDRKRNAVKVDASQATARKIERMNSLNRLPFDKAEERWTSRISSGVSITFDA